MLLLGGIVLPFLGHYDDAEDLLRSINGIL